MPDLRAPDFGPTRILPGIELSRPGAHQGSFDLLWSDNANPLGVYPIPAMSVIGCRPGPTVLLLAGVHGDEYEGPVALTRLFQTLSPEEVSGRLILLPMLNAPACRANSRCSPLDGGNLNRAFPGDAEGGPTAQIAHLVSACLMPVCDAVIDLHSGGKASWFEPCALAARQRDGSLDPDNMALATAFGAEVIWVLGGANDNRSVNGAATALGLTCIAAELGGAGRVGPGALAVAEAGLHRSLIHLGVLQGPLEPGPEPLRVELAGPGHRVTAPISGLYVPDRRAGQDIASGARLGRIIQPDQPAVPPIEINARCDGLILAETCRAAVIPGAFIAFIASEVA